MENIQTLFEHHHCYGIYDVEKARLLLDNVVIKILSINVASNPDQVTIVVTMLT